MATEIDEISAALRAAQTGGANGDELLTLKVLCDRIGYAEQTIRNLISQGHLKRGKHFVQRRRHGKLLFIWSAMERWLRERELDRSAIEPFIPTHARTRKSR